MTGDGERFDSGSASILSAHEIICSTPEFLHGHRATIFSVLEEILPPDVFSEFTWKPVWQRICADERCGYVPFPDRRAGLEVRHNQVWSTTLDWDISFRLHKLHGAPITFTFTAQSSLYRLERNTAMLEASQIVVTPQPVYTTGGTYGSASAIHFTERGTHYLLTANYWDGNSTEVDSILYKIDPGTFTFSEVQRIPTKAAYQWTKCPQEDCQDDDINFNMGGVNCITYAAGGGNEGRCRDHGACHACGCSCADECGNRTILFVLASFSGKTSVFTWDYLNRTLVYRDIIQTKSATSAQCFAWSGSTYLGITQFFNSDTHSHDIESLLMKWDGARFKDFQTFPTTGAREFKFFKVGTTALLSITCEMTDYTGIYMWNETFSRFVEHQRLITTRATSSDFFMVKSVALLGVSQSTNCKSMQTGIENTRVCSFLYRWNGTKFTDYPGAKTYLSDTTGGQPLPASFSYGMLHVDLGQPQIGDSLNPRFVLAMGGFESRMEVQTTCLVDYVERSCMKKTRNVVMPLYMSDWEPLDGVLQGPSALAVSPNAVHLYVAARESGLISIFSIHNVTGRLTFKSSLRLDFDISSLTLVGTEAGSCLYVTSRYPGSLRVYDVSETGSLFPLQTFQQNRSSADRSVRLMDGLIGAASVAIQVEQSSETSQQ